MSTQVGNQCAKISFGLFVQQGPESTAVFEGGKPEPALVGKSRLLLNRAMRKIIPSKGRAPQSRAPGIGRVWRKRAPFTAIYPIRLQL